MAKGRRKQRGDWVAVAARALVQGGWDSVKVEPLARSMGVTKGSFYWHFRDRRELLDAVIESWQDLGTERFIEEVERGAPDPDERLRTLFALTTTDEAFEIEMAIRDLARRDPFTRAAVEDVDGRRMAYVRGLFRALGHDAKEAETRTMLLYSLIIGDRFIAPRHGRLSRRRVLDRALELLVSE